MVFLGIVLKQRFRRQGGYHDRLLPRTLSASSSRAANEVRVVNLKVRPLVELGRVLGHVREIDRSLGSE